MPQQEKVGFAMVLMTLYAIISAVGSDEKKHPSQVFEAP